MADHAALKAFLGVKNRADVLTADRENASGLLLGFDDHLTIGYFADYRLSEVDIFTRAESIFGSSTWRRLRVAILK